MIKYLGKYKVLCEWDRATLEPIKEDTYIACRKDGQIYRVDGNTLAFYKPTRSNSNKFCDKLLDVGVKGVENRSSSEDTLIYFNEESLDIVAKEVNASTNGVNRNPASVKNLRNLEWFKNNKEYYIQNGLYSENKKELSEEEKQKLVERMKKIRLNKQS